MNIIPFPLPSGLRVNSPKRIIIHAMGENVIGEDGITRHASAHLEHEGYSAHVLACPNGDKYRCRQDRQGAAHAKGFNQDSLGLEGLVKGTHDYASFLKAIKKDWVSKEQYDCIVNQCREWYQLYPIEQIDRHSDVDPTRKRDPGDGFPWEQLKKDLGVK